MIHLFGDRLKELRKSKNITQTDIAKMYGVTDATVSAWEVGKAQPSYDVLTNLAQYFNVTTDYLLGFNQDDLDNIERLKLVLREAGMLNGDNEDMTKEDFEKAMQIVSMLKEKK